MTNEVLQAIEARRSCRSYEERQILPEELSAVTRAGTWAPTGMGRQAVKIVVVQNKDTLAKLERMNAAVLGNPDAHPFYGAPTVLVVFADSTVPTHVPDGSLVLGTMLLAASSIGLGSCWINQLRWLQDNPVLRAYLQKLGMAEDEEVCASLSIGYPDTPDGLPGRRVMPVTGNPVVYID